MKVPVPLVLKGNHLCSFKHFTSPISGRYGNIIHLLVREEKMREGRLERRNLFYINQPVFIKNVLVPQISKN